MASTALETKSVSRTREQLNERLHLSKAFEDAEKRCLANDVTGATKVIAMIYKPDGMKLAPQEFRRLLDVCFAQQGVLGDGIDCKLGSQNVCDWVSTCVNFDRCDSAPMAEVFAQLEDKSKAASDAELEDKAAVLAELEDKSEAESDGQPAVLAELDETSNATSGTELNMTSNATVGWLGGAKKPDGKTVKETLLVRALSYQPVTLQDVEQVVAEQLILALDQVERALLDPALEQKMPSSGIYVHIVPPIPGSTERDMKLIKVLFDSAVQTRLMAHAARLLKVKLESITVKVWVSAGESPLPLRLEARSESGWNAWALREQIAAKTGRPVGWVNVETEEEQAALSVETPLEAKLHAKRSSARRAGSTYIYDFLGLFRHALIQRWLAANPGKKGGAGWVDTSSSTLNISR